MTGHDHHKYDLVLFDFDGTLYDSEDHFDRYVEHVTRQVPQRGADIQAAWAAYKAGQSRLRIGEWFSLAERRTRPMPQDGQTPEGSYIGDAWWIVHAIGSLHGATDEQMTEAFLNTREEMMKAPQNTPLLVGMAEWLQTVCQRDRPILCLATNSPEADSRAILAALGVLDCFQDITYSAQKPGRMPEHLHRLASHFHVLPKHMLSIGDHYYNDIKPALDFGADGLFINRHAVVHPREATYEASSSDALMKRLTTLIEARA
ncbi:MAG: HAD family hydrolase [Firmicutes bacterium]|nr:HAD family hydrolase [Bacillota bacterium]